MSQIRDARLESDHGQFVITDLGGADLTVTSIDSNPLMTFDADAATFLSVMTGASYGPVGISSIAHADEPSPGPEWEEIVDVSVTCASGLVVAELMDEGLVPLVEGGGHYRVRVSARGRDEAAAREREAEDEEYDAVLEHFLVEAWPASPAPMAVPRTNARLGRQPDASPNGRSPHAAMRESAGLAACAAIGRDLDGAVGARGLSGATGSMNVEQALRGKRARYFRLLTNLYGWWGSCIPAAELAVGDWFWLTPRDDMDEHRIIGDGGAIVCTYTDFGPQSFVCMTWSWLVPPPGEGTVTWDKLVPFLDPAANLRFDLTQDAGAADGPITTVKVSLENLPVEWIDDLTAYWTYKLGEAERVYTVNYRD